MRFRYTTRKLLVVTSVFALSTALVLGVLSLGAEHLVGVHQRAVSRELLAWGNEYSNIEDEGSAIRAAEMVGYIAAYYRPAAGYRSTPDAEQELEAARKRSIGRIVHALENYTGIQFGDDAEAWKQWAADQRHVRHVDGELPR